MVKSLWTISKIPGTTTNTKYFRCSYQLQCNVVFSDQFNPIICLNLSTRKKLISWLRFPHYHKKQLAKKIIINKIVQIFSQNSSKLGQRSKSIGPLQFSTKKSPNYYQSSCQTKQNLIVLHEPHSFRKLCQSNTFSFGRQELWE